MSIIPFGFWSGQQSIITSNLIFYYDPANPSSYPGSGTSLTDLSGNGHTATLVNGVGFDTEAGGVFIFDGSNDFITLPAAIADDFVNQQDFTIEFWLKPSMISTPSQQIFFSIVQNAATQSRLHCRFYSSGIIRFAYFSNDLDSSSGQVVFNEWVHITMRYRSSDDTSTIFKNGVQIAQSNVGGLLSSTDRIVRIGQWNNSEYWRGRMGAMYAYSVPLTDSEILQNYNTLKSRYTNLIFSIDSSNTASYPGSGTAWYDLVGANDLTLVNGPTYDSGLGGTLNFDGTNDYANRASFPGFGQVNRTVSVWFNIDQVSPSGNRRIVNFPVDDGGADVPAFTIGYGTTTSSMEVGFGAGGGTGYITGITFTAGTWMNITATIHVNNNGIISVYKNNTLVNTGQWTSGGINANPPMNVGRYNANYGQYGDFKIGKINIYDKILSFDERTAYYNLEKTQYGL